ncbi:3 5 -cyclic nucleotide phosphodiesterase domain-containing protein [Cystoisospora suis]|uniref:Phosphodiesterase n=1 Tax=Cystoisospora suis TaxID=483139 RepID=A0A2C6LBH3_9APIC|nr:3 5 -cyclic nucleotide phosphodiesterase domain-containing protein [Cystoisospora suis]
MQDLEATQRRLRRAHRHTMLPTWIITATTLIYVLFEGGRMLYDTTIQQWSEEAILHVDKEVFVLQEFASGFYSLTEQLTADYCFLKFMENPSLTAEVSQEGIRDLLSSYAPSLCSWQKDLYFFDEPVADTSDTSTPHLLNSTYTCGKTFADLIRRINGDMVELIENYTVVKMSTIDMVAPLMESPELTPHVLCDLDFSPADLTLCQSQLMALEQLRIQLTEYVGRDWHLFSPLITIVIIFILSSFYWGRRNVFTSVFHTRFESLWAMLQQIDQVLQRRLENMVVIMQCVIDERMIGRLKVISGIQSLLLASESPAVMRQFYRVMESCTFGLLDGLSLASQYVKLEMQSSAESREMVNIRLLIDGCIQVFRNETTEKGISITCHYGTAVPTSLALDKVRMRTVLLRVLEFALIENQVLTAEVKLTAKKAFLGKAQAAADTEKRTDLRNFDIQISIKCKMAGPTTFEPTDLLESAYLRLRRGKGVGFIYAKKVLKEIGGDIQISVTEEGEVTYDLFFQALGRFHSKDFHLAFGAIKNAVALTMNAHQLKGYNQLASVAELVGVKLIQVSSVAEAAEHLLSHRNNRTVAIFFHDPAGIFGPQLATAVPAGGRHIPIVEILAEGDRRSRDYFERDFRFRAVDEAPPEVSIEIPDRGRRGSTTRARSLLRDSRAPHQARIVSIEEPLMASDVVTAMAIGAASFVSAKQGSKELLRNLSYGRRSFWDGFVSSFSSAVGRVLIFNQSGSISSLASHDMERIAEPPIARFHDPVAFKLFRRVTDVPIQHKYYAYFVVNRVNEVGFATNVLDLYKNMVLDQHVPQLPEEKNMSFYELTKTREYFLSMCSMNECLEIDYEEDYLGKLLGAEIDPTDTRTLVKKVYEEFEREPVEVIDEDDEQSLSQDEAESQEATISYVWAHVPEYTVPTSITSSVARMDTVLCLAPVLATEARLKKYTENAPQVAVEFIFSWDFDMSCLDQNLSAKLAYELLIWCADKAQINVPLESCTKLVLSVQQNYYNNPFHNFNHALHAAQAVLLITKDLSFQQWFTYEDKFIIMLAALGHDIGHPGVTNEFLISMRSFTSILFNETAVLENYHSLLFLDLLKNPDLDILRMLAPEAVQKARQRIIGAILATDKALDMKLLDLLMELRNKNDKVPVPASLLEPSIRDACLIHAADHALALLNFPLYRKWAERMLIEMHFQNTMDEALKLPRSYPGISRLSEATLAGSQVILIDSHYLPFFSTLAWFFPGDLDMRVSVMKANAAFWQHLRDEEMKKTVALNDNPEKEDCRAAKLQVITSKLLESRDKMHQKAAEIMRHEVTEVYYEPHPLKGSPATDPVKETSELRLSSTDQEGTPESEDPEAQAEVSETGGDLPADRQADGTAGSPDASDADQEAGKSVAPLQPALAGKGRGNLSSGRASLRARFADDVAGDKDCAGNQFVGGDVNGEVRKSDAVEQKEQPPQEAGTEETGETQGQSGVPREAPAAVHENQNAVSVTHPLQNESGSQSLVAGQGPVAPLSTASLPESGETARAIPVEPVASPPTDPGLEQSTEPAVAVPALNEGAAPSAQGSGHGTENVVTSVAEGTVVQPVSEGGQYSGQEAMPAFMYDEISGMLFDEQGYAYDQQGNLRGYLDGTGTFQAYTEDELQYYAAALNGNQPHEPE